MNSLGTPIQLLDWKQQISFVGEVNNERIKHLIQMKDLLVVMVFKWVLGKDYVKNENHPCCNSNIVSQFMSLFLDLDIAKLGIIELFHAMFDSTYLDGLGEVVQVTLPSPDIQSTMKIQRHVDNAEAVLWLHFLMNF